MKIVTGEFCGKCKIAKQTLTSKGYVVEEIPVDSEKGKEIIDKTQIKELPILINEGKIMSGQEVVNFANSIKKK